MATASSVPAWRIPWTEEPGGLQSMLLFSHALVSDCCDPMDCSTQSFPVLHRLLELLKLRLIESVITSNYLILCRPFSSCRVTKSQTQLKRLSVHAHYASGIGQNTMDFQQVTTFVAKCQLRIEDRIFKLVFCVFQFSSVAQSCPTLCGPMDCSTPGLPVHHQLPEFTQIRVH